MFEIGTTSELITSCLPVIYAFGIVHVLAIIGNYGMIYAAMSRSDLEVARKDAVKNVLLAALLCLPGIFSLFFVLADANAIKYGIKFWPVETKRFSKKWYEREQAALTKDCEPLPKWRPRSLNNTGRCSSIW